MNNESGVAAFKLANGYAGLKDALNSESVRFQSKALNLIDSLVNEKRSDIDAITKLGFPGIMNRLASNEDPEVREAAVRGLVDLAPDRCLMVQVKDHDKFRGIRS